VDAASVFALVSLVCFALVAVRVPVPVVDPLGLGLGFLVLALIAWQGGLDLHIG